LGQSSDLVDALKRELRARRITYQQVAHALGMAESSVKRMFSSGNLTLERLETICEMAEIDYGVLVRVRTNDLNLVTVLTERQEAELVSNPKLFLVAVCLMNLVSFDEILETYALGAAEVVGHLARLDRIGFIKLLPNNRYRLLLARTFGWIPNGPMQQFFKANAPSFFKSDFSAPNEMLVFVNVRLAPAHIANFLDRLKRIARDLSDQHTEDSSAPLAERQLLSLLIAARPWHMDFMQELLRTVPVRSR
jgi:transcriptional regulator with XRE-family HTH domain